MKKGLLLLLAFSCFLSLFAQKAVIAATESMQLKELSYDFGKIPQGRPVIHIFEALNTGKAALQIQDVQASCGCTTPEWNTVPIAPGAISPITVGFNAASEGQFSKTITIHYNGEFTKTLVITGNVYKTPATSAPLNPSLSLIKQINQ